MGMVDKVIPVAAPGEAAVFGDFGNFFPVGFAVVIAVIRGVPHDDLAVIYYRKIDRKAVIMIGLSTFGVGHDIAVLRSALCIKCILFLICAEAICNLYRNIFFCSFFF